MSKAQKFCAYRDRCVWEMELKLTEWGLVKRDIDDIIDELVETDFINEDRYLLSYTRGKFSNNSWGKNKIRHALRLKNITDEKVEWAIKKINDADYKKMASKLLTNKIEKLSRLEPRSRKSKAYYYMVSKGYEPQVFIPLLEKLDP